MLTWAKQPFLYTAFILAGTGCMEISNQTIDMSNLK